MAQFIKAPSVIKAVRLKYKTNQLFLAFPFFLAFIIR